MLPQELAIYIIKYGYVAIFSLVFAQEMGVPNPVPNELILLFAGYLTYTKALSLGMLFTTVVVADCLGTVLLYLICYFFGYELMKRWPKLFNKEKIHRLEEKIVKKGRWGVYLGRLIPYVRGYTSVAAGLIKLSPWVYLPAVVFSALTWSGGYVLVGHFLGNRWTAVASRLHLGTAASSLLIALVIAVWLLHYLHRRGRRQQAERKVLKKK